ncbi:MAG TPA: FHA domain-containing protein [Isosphaeraceae bacterium]|jgi:pSer/pThr/pTyr-binding forkhead associated (FHA) protein
MKVQLIVVQGKPEGKTIPLLVPRFKIGRGETCHLRPNSEQVSREHAEFVVEGESVSVTDLGSRNGTLVNGRALTAAHTLKNGDLVQVGPLTFAVSIEGASQPKASIPSAPAAAKVTGSLDDVSNDEIDSWLVADREKTAPDTPSGVYSGDTITISAFKDAANPQPAAKPETTEDSDEEYERLEDESEEGEGEDEEAEASDEMPEDFIDESNPFYVKKKKPDEAGGPAKPQFKDTSDAATEILRKMMERKKQQKS